MNFECFWKDSLLRNPSNHDWDINFFQKLTRFRFKVGSPPFGSQGQWFLKQTKIDMKHFAIGKLTKFDVLLTHFFKKATKTWEEILLFFYGSVFFFPSLILRNRNQKAIMAMVQKLKSTRSPLRKQSARTLRDYTWVIRRLFFRKY